MQRPKPPQPNVDIRRVAKHPQKLPDGPWINGIWPSRSAASLCRSMLQNRAGLRGMPNARRQLQGSQRNIVERFQIGAAIHEGGGSRVFGSDPVDAARLRMHHLGSADFGVVPIESIDRTVRADIDAEADPMFIVGEEKIVAVPAHVAAPLALEDVGEDGVLVNIGHEDAPPIGLGKGIRLVDPGATVR